MHISHCNISSQRSNSFTVEQEHMSNQKKKSNGTAFTNGSFEKLADAGRQNIEAFVAASNIAAQGFGEVNQAWVSFAKSAIERNSAAAEAVFAAKTPADAVELQTDWARSAFDNYMSESSKIAELAVKTANDAIAPIRARIDIAVENINETAVN
jgi:phasin family protein